MPTPDIEPLLARSSWVHALARSLAADSHAANDLVQDAWVAALERPPRDGSRLPRWLAVVMQNFARQSWRGDVRRAARERSVARDEAVESDASLLERLELSRALAAEVAALAEPYRTVVLLRYFEGLSPREIARRLDIPLRTVHIRLSRALTKLRGELRRDPERWQLTLLPITTALSRGTDRSLGALLVTTGSKVAAVALALAGLVAWTVLSIRDGGSADSSNAPITLARGDEGLESNERIELAPGAGATATRSESAPSASESGVGPTRPSAASSAHVIRARVVDAELRPIDGAWVALGDAHSKSDASGAFSLGVQRGDEGRVLRAVKQGWLPAQLTRQSESNRAANAWPDPLVLKLGAEPLSIRGRILDAKGAPVENAEILSDDTTHFGVVDHEALSFVWPATVESLVRGDMFSNSVVSDAEGRFALDGLLPKSYRLYAFDRKALISALTDPIAAGTHDVVIRFADEPRHDRIAGRVVSLRGDPIAGAEVSLRRDVQRADGPDGSLTTTVTNGETITSDAQGRFEFRNASKAVTGIDVSGPMLNLGTFRPLAAGEDVEAVEITVALKCHVQLDLTSSMLSGDSFAMLDERGETMSLTVFQGNVAWAQESFELIAGRSQVLAASETGRTILLTKGGAEVARIPVQLRAGEVNVIRP